MEIIFDVKKLLIIFLKNNLTCEKQYHNSIEIE